MWQSFETQNQGVMLDEPMAEQLNDYLTGKESELSHQIIELIFLIEGIPSLKDNHSRHPVRLSDAVEEFGRKVRWAGQSPRTSMPDGQWKVAAHQINEKVWNYLEVLEGCVVELFQQLDQIGFEHWNVDLVRTATSIKDELNHRMEDLLWAVRRLEEQLKTYKRGCEARNGNGGGWRKIFTYFSRMLDRSLEPSILKCSKFLNFRYRKFLERYAGYLQMHENVQEKMDDLYSYRVLSSMDVDQQDKIKQLCFYLDLWEQNNESRMLQRAEPVRVVRNCLSSDRAGSLLHDYYDALLNAVFDKSRLIKQQFRHVFIDKQSREPILDNVSGYRDEIRFLVRLIAKYNRFLSQSSRGSDRSLKSLIKRLFVPHDEPKQQKDLQKLSSNLKKLDAQAAGFYTSLKHDPLPVSALTPELKDEINHHLHEMAQPLASKDLMRRSAKWLVVALQRLDEMGSFDPNIVRYICRTLSRAMCKDWKYHVLQDNPAFHHVYQTHERIINLMEDRQHQLRLGKFQRVLSQLDGWIRNDEMVKRAHEVELDVNDIKAYLQDYLASVQRLEPKTEGSEHGLDDVGDVVLDNAAEAFLQYLYLFGQFFARLDNDRSDHRLLRRHLLFIDQYFEEIERKLQSFMGY